MKANKFFAVALAALTMVGFNACQQPNTPVNPQEEEDALVLDKTSIQLEVEGTETITATVAATWVSSDAEVATVVPGNDGGKTALVTALKEGSAVISATTKGGQVKTCIVAVKKKGGDQPVGGQLKGSQVWPIILDGTTLEANQSKVVASFQPNDVDQFLYVWEGTYEGVQATGMNFHGNTDGYLAMSVTQGWSGCGFCLTDAGTGWQNAESLRAAIVANPDQYFLHLAIKSTDNYSHCFYMFGLESTKFVLGDHSVYDGPVKSDFTRDGSWQEFDIPMSQYASALASGSCAAGVNVFVVLTEGVVGAKLNLDAVYFYKN